MSDTAYSPHLRTGVVLTGSGTAGAYQAGALRAITEAGVKVDVLAAHGAGAATAFCGAVDGGASLWGTTSPWADGRLKHAYRWRPALRAGGWGLLGAAALLLSPLLVLIFAAVMYAASLLAALVNWQNMSARLVEIYRGAIEILFSPPILPTIVPRAVVLALAVVVAVLVIAAVRAIRQERSRRRFRGAFWWRLVGTPLDAAEPGTTMVDALWRLVRGASSEPRPAPAEIGRRYVELLADNFGQPGFREVLVAVHDLDARRDLVGAVLAPSARAAFEARRPDGGVREAEIVDLTGPSRSLVVDFLLGALRLPLVSGPQPILFPIEGFWRGERHHVCDRPELTLRLIEELVTIGVEQVIIVSPAAAPSLPHAMRAGPLDLRARMGAIVRSIETSALEDARAVAARRFSSTFVVRPDHNPIGPFDVGGTYDESSDRRRSLAELMQQGYDDAYRQFIEPVVAAGERIEAI